MLIEHRHFLTSVGVLLYLEVDSQIFRERNKEIDEMIIKTQYGLGWRFDDHVSNIESFHPDNVPDVSRYEDVQLFEVVSEEYEVPKRQIVVIHGNLPNGETIGITTNRSVYLLDDSGRTIERLN